KKAPIVVDNANFYRTPATAARQHPTGSTGSGNDGSDANLKVVRAVVGARSVGCVCCPPEMTVAVGGQFYDSSPSSSTGRWALLLSLAYPPERTLSRWDEFAGQLNAIDLSKLKKLLTNLNIRLR